MKTISFYLIAIFISILLFVKGEEDVSHCLVKYNSEWNKPCTQCSDYSKSYRVYFRNECEQKLDVKVAAQEADKRWRTFNRLEMLPKDTIVAYACKGTGKYMTWVRKTGDATFVFPTDEEINNQYSK